jgi:hypothetical protein
MMKLILRIGLVGALCSQLLSIGAPWPRGRGKMKKDSDEIVVIVRYMANGPTYEVRSNMFTNPDDLTFYLGELRPHRDAPLLFLMEENVPLWVLHTMAASSIAMGFTNLHAYVYWPFTKKMAEIQFGPVTRFSKNPPPQGSGDYQLFPHDECFFHDGVVQSDKAPGVVNKLPEVIKRGPGVVDIRDTVKPFAHKHTKCAARQPAISGLLGRLHTDGGSRRKGDNQTRRKLGANQSPAHAQAACVETLGGQFGKISLDL